MVLNFTEERLFELGMWWRIGYGILRIVLGLAALKVVGMSLIDVIHLLMSHELIEDPGDLLYRTVSYLLVGHPLYISSFISVYFIFWGVVDIVLSYNLLKHHLWAFPASIVIVGFFIAYETIRFTYTHSMILLGVILIDMSILWLVWREYKRLQTLNVYR